MIPLSPAITTSLSPDPHAVKFVLDDLKAATQSKEIACGGEGCVYELSPLYVVKVVRHNVRNIELLVNRLIQLDEYTVEQGEKVLYLSTEKFEPLVIPTHQIVLNCDGMDWIVMSRGVELNDAVTSPCNEHKYMQQIVELIGSVFESTDQASSMDIKYSNMLMFDDRVVLSDICCAAGTMSYLPYDGGNLEKPFHSDVTKEWVTAVVILEFYLKTDWWNATTITPEQTRGFLPNFPNITALLSVAASLGLQFGFTAQPDLVSFSPTQVDQPCRELMQTVFRMLYNSLLTS